MGCAQTLSEKYGVGAFTRGLMPFGNEKYCAVAYPIVYICALLTMNSAGYGKFFACKECGGHESSQALYAVLLAQGSSRLVWQAYVHLPQTLF